MLAKPAQHVRRVLMTADTVGGVWTYALELAQGLARCGVEVLIAAMTGGRSWRGISQTQPMEGVKVVSRPLRLEWMENPWADVAAAGEWLLSLSADFEPDVVHLNSYCLAALPWKSPTLVVGHSCVLSWHEAVHGTPAPSAWDVYRWGVRQGLRAASGVTAPTATMLECLARHYGSFAALPPVANGRRAASRPDIRKQAKVLTVGRLWDEAKNLRTLDAAAAGLGFPVYAAGPTAHEDLVFAVPKSVRLLGTLDSSALGEWYARAAVFACPARYEPFGLTALEAAHAGCALVLGDIPSQREVWGKAAIFVPPDDADALRWQLQRLLQDESRCRAHGMLALRRAQRYSPDRMSAAYIGHYQRLLQLRSTVQRAASRVAAGVQG